MYLLEYKTFQIIIGKSMWKYLSETLQAIFPSNCLHISLVIELKRKLV